LEEDNGTGSDTHGDETMTSLPNKCHKATEEEDDRETLRKEIWRGKCGQPASGSLEEDGDDSTRQSGVETNGLWSMIHWE